MLPSGFLMAIYVHRNDQRLGPYTLTEVRSQLASGALSLNDHVWWTGQEGWTPLVGSEVLKPGFEDPDPAAKKKDDGETGLSSFSVAALVAGCLPFIAFFATIPAIVFGHCALYELKQHPLRTGRRMAIAGLVLGYIFTLLWAGVVGWYYYDYDKIEAIRYREELVNSDVFVPPVPGKTGTPSAAPVPATTKPAPAIQATPATNAAPPASNLDQPLPPATANPQK